MRDLAPHRPDFVKIWVDDRNGRQKKLTPPLYGAAADEAHTQGLRAIAHVYTLDDAKGLVRAGVVGFLHLVRDTDIDEELIALLKQHPGVFFGPNIGITSRGLDASRPRMARRAAAARDHSAFADPEARAVVCERKPEASPGHARTGSGRSAISPSCGRTA